MFARWGGEDIASGASDWQVWDVATRHQVPFFACPDLHAKVYVADDRALVGSANATPSGLSGGAKGNLELLLEVDASGREVVEIIDQIRVASALAPPLGPDVQPTGRSGQTDSPIWLPRSDPETFLDAMVGRKPHNDETERDREALRLRRDVRKRSEIASAVREMTAFRLVMQAFQTRMVGMRQADLLALLSEQLGHSLVDLPVDRSSLLARWLGLFGENTHLAPTGPEDDPVLEPGPLVSQEHRQVRA